jgi:hypothetical protein
MPIKCPKNFQSWQDDRHPYEIFFDQMYQAYLQEKHDNNEKDILLKTDYFEANQDFLLTKYKEEA